MDGNNAASESSRRLRTLVEGSLCVAMSAVLSGLRIFEMPQGGSVTLEMAPLFYFASRRGGRWGVIAGAVSGTIQLLFSPQIVHPAQAVLDYPLAFACVGVAGFFGRNAVGATLGAIVATALRLACHVLSGVIFFASFTPDGQNVWIYSLTYNAAHMIPSGIIAAAAAWALRKKFLAPK